MSCQWSAGDPAAAPNARRRPAIGIRARCLLTAAALAFGVPAMAQPLEPSPFDSRPPQSGVLEPDDGAAGPTSIQSSLGPFGDPGGFRAALSEHGVTYNVLYTNEVLGNASGGFRRGAIYAGKLETIVTADLEKLAGLSGLSFFANMFQIHDTGGLRDRSFGRLITVSNIEAYPATRLSELWLEQKWGDERFGLRVGQLTADGEFFSSNYGKVFLSNDWPTFTGANLPSGGPAYPISTPGLRFRYAPTPQAAMLVAVFNGDPGEQRFANRTGTNFPVDDPPLVMAELQYRFNQDKGDAGMATSLKLGGYHHFGRFDDQRFDTSGISLASLSSNGIARRLRGTSGVYGVIDQQIYRPEGGGHESGISVYARISGSPSDAALLDVWMDGGIVFSDMIPGRPNDKFGASVIVAKIGESARAFDRDLARLLPTFQPIRGFEASIEISYQAEIVPGWLLQPDFQYVFNPQGGVVDPLRPDATIKGGAVFGFRSTIVY